MKKKVLVWITRIPLLLLLPYLSIIYLQGVDTALKIKTGSVEDFLPVIVEKQISKEYETEVVKCQAVIARSNFYRHYFQNEDFLKCIAGFLDLSEESEKGKRKKRRREFNWLLYSERSWSAVEGTEGEVLLYNGDWKMLPYHEISNGKTRNGEEVFHSSEYAYLKAVNSEMDTDSDAYLNSVYLPKGQIPESLEISGRDSSGYVLCLNVNGRPIEGEAFRDGMHLSSSDFTVQKVGEQYRILCKGRGHGLGLSQYGANALAKNGRMYDFILRYYFPKLELCKIENLESETITGISDAD